MNKFESTIGGVAHTIVRLDYQPETKTQANALHHIHILDRSGSMRDHIDQLIDNVQETFKVIKDTDYYSIIWFSSPRQFKTLIKGARKTDDVKSLINTIRSVLGTTCFSDPVKEARTIVDDLKSLCPNIVITLFTDGDPVCPWSSEKEEEMTIDEILRMRSNIIAFNTIGYGAVYNRDFLIKMAQTSQHGTMHHAYAIDDYYKKFLEGSAQAENMTMHPVTITAPKGTKVLYVNTTHTKMLDGIMSLGNIANGTNTFYLIGTSAFDFTVNGKTYKTSQIQAEQSADVETFLYAYAYNLFYNGNRADALDIMAKNIRDRYYAEKQINVFTYDEVQEYLDTLKPAIFDKSKRMRSGKCPPRFIPKADALCVMDVLGELVNGNNYYVPFSERVSAYQRIGKKTTDEGSLFTASKDEVITPLTSIVWNKAKLNISLRIKIDGTVKLNPKAAERVKLPAVVDASIYRNHTFIKDGALNIKRAEFIITDSTLSKFLKTTVPLTIVQDDPVDKGHRVIIDFSRLPIINKMYIDRSADIEAIYFTVLDQFSHEAYSKVLNHYLNEVYNAFPSMQKEEKFKNLTVDQINVLRDHGLNETFSYSGIDRKTEENDVCDTYMVRTIEFYLKGASKLPTVKEALAGKAGYVPQAMRLAAKKIKEAVEAKNLSLDKPNLQVRDLLTEMKTSVDCYMQAIRVKINTLKMAKILTGDWFTNLSVDRDGNYIYEHAADNMTLVIHTARKVEHVSAAA